MNERAPTATALLAALPALLLCVGVDRAFADLTVFAGIDASTSRTAVGAALGLPLEPFGLEFEYARMRGDGVAGRPALQTSLFNLLLGTPVRTGRRVRIYAALGGGAYRERLEEHARTGLAAGAGGGVHLRLAGPFRLRLDYRLLAFRGGALHRRLRRAYAGLDLAF